MSDSDDKIPYYLRPLSLMVEEILDMAIVHDGIEMQGQVDIKISHSKAIELIHILIDKVTAKEKIVLFTLKGKIK